MSIECSSADGDAYLWSCITLKVTSLIILLCWNVYTTVTLLISKLAVKCWQRIQILVLIVISLRRYKNFYDLRHEIINVKTWKNQDENAQLKQTMANFKHKIIILETPTNSVEQYDRRNNIEITAIPDNIRDEHH